MRMVKGCPSTSMDDYQLNTTTLIRHAVRNFPEQEILYRANNHLHRYTYKDAYTRMSKVANFLENKLGVKPGDKIGVLDWNSHRHFELYFAIPGIGATLLQMNLRISPDDLAYVTNHSEATYIFVDESLISVAEAIAPLLNTVKGFIIMTDKPMSEIKTNLSPIYHYEVKIIDESAVFDWPMVEETTAYSACYTSGTTGRPKGVYYSHRNIYLHTLKEAALVGANSHDCLLVIVPMFHGQSWGLVHTATMMGAKMIFPGRYTAEDTSPLVDLMIEENVTITAGSPAIFLPMLHYIRTLNEKPDLSRARFLSGATEPPISMMRGFKELTGAEIIHAYGATETTPLVAMNYLLNPILRNRLTDEEKWDLKRKQGLQVSGIDYKLCDPVTGDEVPRDGKTVGEICLRGPWITGAYHNAPETEHNFRDGYWRSGDAGTIDQYGYVKVVDRIKDVIKSGGEWISSIDLENTFMDHPDVLEAVVVGIPHEKWQERPLALVVTKNNKMIPRQEFEDLLYKHFAKWQFPDEILFVEEIPKTSVGKFNKKEIVKKYKNLYQESSECEVTTD
ncbi:long-chain-fatty-acid--CoA ligase [Bacillus sp. DTU_2020_1000418_1_SI_GHA_SEK_038]|uniref:long-chain-fatty-acid--CoA ligase n=1 Tax=Bacillus sp. DTU_2020_1000418_1_SI_GHA_SEK_038 TaxID=3077585 RepID=UPI0028E78151|nr:long-chain-fatty-acid--CoA ligase [Bacillus sp. DTU_2020_1000418_1_SI_GHA_SEK_038]WNS76174.1 long-chain-fatty-acid--CoA ligase [Bacillus sp. DTU_2020_1000418_1_SI_GHA_SEK_038]